MLADDMPRATQAAIGVSLEPEERTRPAAAIDDPRERLLAAIPLAERRLEIGGVRTAVLEGGDGPPLVLLHGGIECGGAYWAPVMSRLADAHRLIVPDVPGLGESKPVARLDAAAFANWLAALLELTCEQKPTLVAHSLLGSSPAAHFAARRGDLLRGLVIYAAPGVGPYRMPLAFRLAAIRYSMRPTERNGERFDRWAFHDLDRTRRRDPEWFRAFMAYTLSRAAAPHVKRTMRRLIAEGTKQVSDAELRRIAVPTALLWGRHDRMVPLGLAEAASAKHDWPLHVVDDAGHAPHIERPEAFVEALGAATRAVAGS